MLNREKTMAKRKAKEAEWLGWYFSDASETLRYGDGRKIAVGTTHTVDVEPELCAAGLHASPSVLQALDYAPGAILWRVKLSGKRIDSDDKSCSTKRTYLARIDAEPLLREFARKCALKVMHLWDAPRVVRDFLETGDESLRHAARDAAEAAARDAAWAAARDAARDAARAAAWDAARDAAEAAARDAAWAAARDAAWAAAWAAARDAARAAAMDTQKQMLEEMALAAIAKQEKEHA